MDFFFNSIRIWSLLLVVLLLGTYVQGEVDCLQCNVFTQGTRNTCDSPRYMTGCAGCLKTFTKIRKHERWLEYTVSESVSRYCIKQSATSLIREAGCYHVSGNGGYTVRCYCYENNCNSVGLVKSSVFGILLALVGTVFTR